MITDAIIKVDDLHKSFGERQVLNGITTELQRGSVTVIIGPSVSGKSTFLKTLVGLVSKLGGNFEFGWQVDVGYFDQQSRVLDETKTIFEEISDAYPKLTQTEIRNILAAFLFTGDDVFKRICDLRGGERGRVSLAKLMLSNARANLEAELKAKEAKETITV